MCQVFGECSVSLRWVRILLSRHESRAERVLPQQTVVSDSLLLQVSLAAKQWWLAVDKGEAET